MIKPYNSPFHADEIAVQRRAGVADSVARYSEGFIRSAMPEQHRDFFTSQTMVIAGLCDQSGTPWAMPLFGKPGFIRSPNAEKLDIGITPELCSLLNLEFKTHAKIGLLGIELQTRRRNRVNGVIADIKPHYFSIAVEQSFGNCPQYIQKRKLRCQSQRQRRECFDDLNISSQLEAASKALIAKADTFFIASRTETFDNDPRTGIDTSHRGGKPGFVKIDGNTLKFPDFSGNRFFNTLGNIVSDGRVGLFFPDFSSGATVFLSGTARIIWEDEALAQIAGAERIIAVDVSRSVYIEHFLKMTGELEEYSPVLKNTGTWHKRAATLQTEDPYHAFKITAKIAESRDITSFYLRPLDASLAMSYDAGQYLPLRLIDPKTASPIFRNYTISQAPRGGVYRISVKREAQGLASRLLHDHYTEGDTLSVGVPAGNFTLANNNRAVVFMSGGVGITPMFAMLEHIIENNKRTTAPRKVWFFHGTQNRATHAFAEQVKLLAQQKPWLQSHTVYSRPSASDKAGVDFDSEGHIDINLLKRILPVDDYDFYLCGSESFMGSIYSGLKSSGVKPGNIFYEFFGEGSLESTAVMLDKVADRAELVFSKSGITASWFPEHGSLLSFAETLGLKPAYSCRTGNCGACRCGISSGEVVYGNKTGFTPDSGHVLLCCARPAKGSGKLIINL